jgi:hypothetical protein
VFNKIGALQKAVELASKKEILKQEKQYI